MIKYIPNCITIFRFCLIPFICILMLNCKYDGSFGFIHPAVYLFFIAAISDFLDGFLARKLKAESDFGKFFDNIADKMLSISVICVLIKLEKIWLLPAIIVILREVLISSLREYMAMTKGKKINVEFFGKLKTTTQFIALPILMQPNFPAISTNQVFLTGNILFAVSAFASLASGVSYLSVFFRK